MEYLYNFSKNYNRAIDYNLALLFYDKKNIRALENLIKNRNLIFQDNEFKKEIIEKKINDKEISAALFAAISQKILDSVSLDSVPLENKDENNSFLDIKDIMKLLSVCRRTVSRYINEKGLPHYKIGRSVLVNPISLKKWMLLFKKQKN